LAWAVASVDGKKVMIRRDIAGESTAISQLEMAGLRFKPLLGRFNAVGETAIEIWGRAKELFPSDWEIVFPLRSKVSLKSAVQATVSVGLSLDGFDVHVGFATSDAPVPAHQVATTVRSGKRFVRLGDGQYAPIDSGVIRVEQALEALGVEAGKLKLALYEVDMLDELLAGARTRDVASDADLLRSQLRRLVPPPHVEPPHEFQGVLRGYQRASLNWLELLRRYRLGGILADDAGLGKKVQVLAMFLGARSENNEPHLVVTSTKNVALWEQHAAQFTPSLERVTFAGQDDAKLAGVQLVITTYDQLQALVAKHGSLAFNVVMFDEAQELRSAGAPVAEAARALKSKNRFGLTSIPVENRLQDLWAMFDIFMPGLLGTAETFQTRYEQPIERDGDDQVREKLKRRIAPFVMRRLRREVANELR
jgi:hypothetical protein